MDSNLRQVQENELRALTAIYTNSLKDLRSKRDKRSKPPYFSLLIVPLRSDSAITLRTKDPSFELIVEETALYPKAIPNITLTNPNNLPADTLQRCKVELENLMKNHLNEEMIFYVAQYAQNFLEEYRPQQFDAITKAVNDETNFENDEQRIEREIKCLREKNIAEQKNKRRGQSDPSTISRARLNRILSETTLHFDEPRTVEARRGHLLHRETHPTIPEQVLYSTYTCTDTESAEIYCLYEWNFVLFEVNEENADLEDFCAQYRKEIGNIQNDLCCLMSLNHNYLQKIVAYRFIFHEAATYTFRVLTEWVPTSSLEVFDSCPLPESLLRKIASYLCEVLSVIHTKSIVHRLINAKSVHLCTTGMKLTRTGFVRRLNDLHISFHDEQLPKIYHRSTKTDIYDMGLLLLNLSVARTYDSILDIPPTLSDEFRDFLHSCANGDSLEELLNDRFLMPNNESNMNIDRLISRSYERDTSSTNDHDSEMLASAQSRLKSDFEVIGILGRGGFGHVFKVQNKLDSCYYAVKQILLKSANKSLNRKITREVKLLSKLNHQNIVRYYSTWTEQMVLSSESKSAHKTTTNTKYNIINRKKVNNGDSLRQQVHGMIPDLSSSNESPKDNDGDCDLSSADSSDDEGGVFDASMYHPIDQTDDMIQFEHGHSQVNSCENPDDEQRLDSTHAHSSSHDDELYEPGQRVLFIQMEYCEGNSLKQFIERGILQEKPKLIWMLLREILEGLKHMHSKGIIHRDLKPGNILLDSNGHAKIGDLGLATISKLSGYVESTSITEATSTSRSSWSIDVRDGGLASTPVGTAFYIAPELLAGKPVVPTDKIDIYSLGITFFEMCYPFNTGMERVKILTELRRSNIHVPDYFHQKSFSRHYQLVNRMLQHEPEKRPSAHALLESNLIPFEQEEKFEQMLNRMIDSSNNDLQSFYYKKTISKLFQRKNDIAGDATFDHYAQIDVDRIAASHRESWTFNSLRNTFIRLFEKYGAFLIRLPIFMPNTEVYNKTECSTLKFITSTGLIVSLPFDSKIPFARFVTRCVSDHGLNGLPTFKCYQISNVYRESVRGMHPREWTECGFDIVFTQSTYLPDAEVLSVCQDLIDELHLQKVFIRLNHSQLLRAILMYSDVPTEKINPIISAIHKGRLESDNARLHLYLLENGMNEATAKRLQSLLNTERTFDDAINELKDFTRAQTEGSKLLKMVIDELETIVKYARAFGVRIPIYLALRVVALNSILDTNAFSGFLFQVASVVHRKKRATYEIYAGGGRYDPLLKQFRRPSQSNSSDDLPHVTGVSFDMERLMQNYSIAENLNSSSVTNSIKPCDTLICLGSQPLDFLRLRHELISNGISVSTLYELPSTMEMLDEYCTKCQYARVIYRREDSIDDAFRFRVYEKSQGLTDKRYNGSQIVQIYRNEIIPNTLANTGTLNTISNQHSDSEQSLSGQMITTPGGSSIKNAPSLSSLASVVDPVSTGAQLNIYIFFTDTNVKTNLKKKIENQVQYKLSTLSSLFTSKSRIDVFIFDIGDSILSDIVSTLCLDDESSFANSLEMVLGKSGRFRDVIFRFGEQLRDLRFSKKSKLFVISSCKTDFYRFMAAFT